MREVEESTDFTLRLRSVWAEKVLAGGARHLESEISSLLRHVPRKLSTVAQVILKLLSGEKVSLENFNKTSFAEKCQLAFLNQDEDFARKLLPFSAFDSLWTSEKNYNAIEAKASSQLLLSSFGLLPEISQSADPYFQALVKQQPRWKNSEPIFHESFAELKEHQGMQAAMISSGEGVPLGALKASGISIQAMGPQQTPLNDSNLFGIYRSLPNLKWGATFANKEIWFEILNFFDGGRLDARFYGFTPARPLFFALYIKADRARIGSEVFLSKRLQRYRGDSNSVIFEKGQSYLKVERRLHSKIELIPLAGERGFWDSDFLLAVEVSPHDGHLSIQFDNHSM